jgi:hypothetical protein
MEEGRERLQKTAKEDEMIHEQIREDEDEEYNIEMAHCINPLWTW